MYLPNADEAGWTMRALTPSLARNTIWPCFSVRKWHPDLDIQRVELVAMIEMLSGSPLN
jgi:hypothetical protein